jgi:coenzyme F420-reducing hydrogenase gamma subunit
MDQTIYAFPTDENADFNNKGMPLRDYFAAKAMQSMIVIDIDSVTDIDAEINGIPETAYMIADAMMKYRNADT